MPPCRNSVILKELSDMVSHYKVFEWKLREAIDIPVKMMQIFRVAKVVLLYSTKGKRLRKAAGINEELSEQELDAIKKINEDYKSGGELVGLINEDTSIEDFKLLSEFEDKIFEKLGVRPQDFIVNPLLDRLIRIRDERLDFSSMDGSFNIFYKLFEPQNPFKKRNNCLCPNVLIEKLILHIDFDELYKVAIALDQQKKMIQFLKSFCLFRDNHTPMMEFDLNQVKVLL